jgi:hypothetical protein
MQKAGNTAAQFAAAVRPSRRFDKAAPFLKPQLIWDRGFNKKLTTNST